ncbi:MAG: MmgE/PrpD family protein [Rhodoferax sp.]|uniref:MmgE/PrpD family protein n=1 Tax=Rhodoferax sp. TaxID=50421 RepID=UPI002734F151|nr:MmgE/PrpD family protein [Rhodoferax sp.]MDP2679048.1 MmgE/PrpD family protein [Rhodoferax sp.]
MLTQALSQWIAGLQAEHIPMEVKRNLRLLSLDTFGCALTGTQQPWTQAITQWALAGESAGTARIWGEARPRLRAADAALVNGAAAHAFEVDDFHNAKVHLGAVILPAVFALGEALNARPERIETAIAAGYEVIIRSSLSLTPARARLRGWHLTSVCGPLGAAAASAVLLGLDPLRTSWALGLAGTQASGLYAFTADGSDSKRFHPGRAAHAGVMAAEMAALGLSGPTQIYEASDGGLLSTFTDEPDPDQLLAHLGEQWHAPQTNFKPYGCCGSAHAHVDAALALRARWRRGGRVRIGMAYVIERQCGYAYAPGTALNAQMSARYAIAAALLHGAVLPAQFEPACLGAPEIVALANAIEIVHDERHDQLYPAHFCGWTEVETSSGMMERVEFLNPSGSASNPDRPAAIRAKFAALNAPVLAGANAEALQTAFEHLDQTPLPALLDLAARPAQ